MSALLVDASIRRQVPRALEQRLGRRLGRMVRAAALHERGSALEVSLLLTDDATIQVLNRGFRRKDKPTDVLAFAQREGQGPAVPGLLGDIVISVETARRQARKGLEKELLHLIAHGLCHLLGYDHRTDREERDMNARAAALLGEAGRRGRVRAA
ncbi:MAG TPA: rRNA maturation RNase YbeY [Kofleriaceae bacterium]|nr:rRNA maturation RNase YbeY [Kofleriaceae bacterium]